MVKWHEEVKLILTVYAQNMRGCVYQEDMDAEGSSSMLMLINVNVNANLPMPKCSLIGTTMEFGGLFAANVTMQTH